MYLFRCTLDFFFAESIQKKVDDPWLLCSMKKELCQSTFLPRITCTWNVVIYFQNEITLEVGQSAFSRASIDLDHWASSFKRARSKLENSTRASIIDSRVSIELDHPFIKDDELKKIWKNKWLKLVSFLCNIYIQNPTK